ncbi:MAG: 3-dehydroquinate synthase, partial [Candidatus Gracilibacteria bacterium]
MQTKIIVQHGVFKNIAQKVKPLGKNFAIITDANIKKQGEELLKQMRGKGLDCNLIILPPGETTKSISYVEKIAKSLLKLGIKRDSCLIALGGGVIGDLTGFVASIFMRGIKFVSIPTTVMAMVDSCIGGKTGVDLEEGKNLLGTFYDPEMIIVDPKMLDSLPKKAFCSGMAEVIKHGIIYDKKLFDFLARNAGKILKLQPTIIKKMVSWNLDIKGKIVEKDKMESIKLEGGQSRMILNYGHTVGHAIEQLSNYKLPHGDAVAIGMVAENRVAVGKKILKESEAERIKDVIKRFNLPTKIPTEYSSK